MNQQDQDVGFMALKCRPIYLPGEFTFILVTALHIQPNANASMTIKQTTLKRYPDAGLIVR